MDNKGSISLENVRAFRDNYLGNTLSQVATKAVSKSEVNDVCYNTQRAKEMEFKFSVNVPTMGALAQQKSGRCWIFAPMNLLREKIAKDLKLEKFELSQNYFCFYDHLEKANSFLERIIDTADKPLDDRFVSRLMSSPVGDGGRWEYFVALVQKYGIVPQEAMPDTYQSSHTEMINNLMKTQLRKDGLELRRALEAKQDLETVRARKIEMLDQIYNLLAIFFGNPPETFDFEYVNKDKEYHADRGLNARTFYDKYLGRKLEDVVHVTNTPVEERPFYKTYRREYSGNVVGGYETKVLNLPIEEMKAAVIRQLQDGDLVRFGCDCRAYGCRPEGIWDPEIYDYETPFGLDLDMSKGDMLRTHNSGSNHAMLLTGVNLVDGKPNRWKIENSWGTEPGDKGYFVMSDEWFDKYVYNVAVDRKYLTEEQNKAYDQEPVIVPSWDIIG